MNEARLFANILESLGWHVNYDEYGSFSAISKPNFEECHIGFFYGYERPFYIYCGRSTISVPIKISGTNAISKSNWVEYIARQLCNLFLIDCPEEEPEFFD